MDVVVEFLLARITDTETDAQAASIGSETWHLDQHDETILWWPPATPAQVAAVREYLGDAAADQDASWGGQTITTAGDRIAPHIARHDPAHVLADCQAKRRIIASVQAALPRGTNGLGPGVLMHLAAVYADHPDYRPEWKP